MLKSTKLLDIITEKSIRVATPPIDADDDVKALAEWRQSLYDEKNMIVYSALWRAFQTNPSSRAHIGLDSDNDDGLQAWKNLLAYIDRTKSSEDRATERQAFYLAKQGSTEQVASFAKRLKTMAQRHNIPDADLNQQLFTGFRDPSKEQSLRSLLRATMRGLSFEEILIRIEEQLPLYETSALPSSKQKISVSALSQKMHTFSRNLLQKSQFFKFQEKTGFGRHSLFALRPIWSLRHELPEKA